MASLFDTLRADPTNRAALAALALAISAAAAGDTQGIHDALMAYGPGSVVPVNWGPGPLQQHFAWVSDQSIVFLFKGLESTEQVLAALLASNQNPTIAVPGQIMSFVAGLLVGSQGAIDAAINNAAASLGVPMVNVLSAGHSNGGGIALGILTQHVGPLPPTAGQLLAVTFGMPRVLDPEAAGALRVPHTRVVNTDDFVPLIPLFDWYNGFPFVLFTPTAGMFYQHHGTGVALDALGRAYYLPPDSEATDANAWRVITAGLELAVDPSTHDLSTYAARLLSRTDPVGGSPGRPPFFGPRKRMGIMATYKTLWFLSQGPWGWSEVHFQEQSDATAALDNARNVQLLTARKNMLGSQSGVGFFQPSITDIRVSNVEKPRDSRRASVSAIAASPPNNQEADIPNTSINLLFRGEATFGVPYQKLQFCRGNPDTLVGKGGQFQGNATWNPALDFYLEKLKDLGFGMWQQDKNVLKVMIASLANVGADILVTTVTDLGLAAGDKVTITGVKPAFSEKKYFTVANPGPNQFTIPNQQVDPNPTALGFAKKVEKIFVDYDTVEVVRANHRIAGRPFFQPRGRKRSEVET